jgi:hypothetical protein
MALGDPYLVLEYIGMMAFAVSGGAGLAVLTATGTLLALAADAAGPVAVLLGLVTRRRAHRP